MQAHAQGNHDCNPHEESRAKSCEIACPEVSQNCHDEVEAEADTGDDAEQRPKNSQDQSQSARKFASGKERKITQGKANDVVNGSHDTRVTTNLGNR